MFVCAIIFAFGCYELVTCELNGIAIFIFGFPMLTNVRLITYKYGKPPIFMSDKTWNSFQFKYSKEEIESKYKEMSIKRATIYFILSVLFFVSFIIYEVVLLLL